MFIPFQTPPKSGTFVTSHCHLWYFALYLVFRCSLSSWRHNYVHSVSNTTKIGNSRDLTCRFWYVCIIPGVPISMSSFTTCLFCSKHHRNHGQSWRHSISFASQVFLCFTVHRAARRQLRFRSTQSCFTCGVIKFRPVRAGVQKPRPRKIKTLTKREKGERHSQKHQ